MAGMREVGLGLALERFTLVSQGDVYGVVDIVSEEAGSLVLWLSSKGQIEQFQLSYTPFPGRVEYFAGWRRDDCR